MSARGRRPAAHNGLPAQFNATSPERERENISLYNVIGMKHKKLFIFYTSDFILQISDLCKGQVVPRKFILRKEDELIPELPAMERGHTTSSFWASLFSYM